MKKPKEFFYFYWEKQEKKQENATKGETWEVFARVLKLFGVL